MENVYNLKKKLIFNIGYTYVEYLQKIIDRGKSDNKILFAPSWVNQKNDLIEKYGKKIISELLKIDDVILRPHPQSLIKSKKGDKFYSRRIQIES